MLDPEENVQFSQHKLQDYVDCARRFQLRYLAEQPSPALIVDSPLELERLVQRGADFHHLVHQHLLGLDVDRLEASIQDPRLAAWWRTYLEHPPAGLPREVVRPEVVLAAPLPVPGTAGARLVARFDLLAADPGGRLAIVDWKTGAPPRTAASMLPHSSSPPARWSRLSSPASTKSTTSPPSSIRSQPRTMAPMASKSRRYRSSQKRSINSLLASAVRMSGRLTISMSGTPARLRSIKE